MPFAVRRTRLATLVTSLAALVLVPAALAGNGGFLPGEPHSPNAHRVHDAFIFVSIFTGVIFVAVEGALIVFMFKYRRGKRARTAEGPQIHGATRLEIIWTVIPVVFLAVIGTFVFYKLPGIADAPKANAADETRIHVQGAQFYWQVTYPNGAVSIDRMVAPAGQVVNEDITAPDWDVIHSWWVPDFGGKYDAIPGRVNKTWFQAPAGTYVARCDEGEGRRRAALAVRRVHREACVRSGHARPRPRGVHRRLSELPPTRPLLHRPRPRRQPAARRSEGHRDVAAERAGADAVGGS
jgi:cytochrome c oxidase subunit 2